MAIVALDKKKHAALTFKSLEDYSFTANMLAMPLMAFEVADAARCFPIVFSKGSAALPHAVLGLGDKNIFVDAQGRWTAPYLPFYAANYPFSLLEARDREPGGRRELALAIVEEAPHFSRKDGMALYGTDGEASEMLRRILGGMGNQYQRHQQSVPALEALAQAGVLRERSVIVKSDGRERAVSGLYVADQEKVMALPDATQGQWVKNGLMEMLYAHWQSMRHLRALLDHPSCPKADPKADAQNQAASAGKNTVH